MSLDIAGQTIRSVSIDHAVTLQTDGGGEIRIETPFSLRSPGGESVVADPERLGASAEHLVAILHETVADAAADEGGTLVLNLVNGLRLEVESDDSYEAWTFAGPNGRKVVARPGGGFTEWSER